MTNTTWRRWVKGYSRPLVAERSRSRAARRRYRRPVLEQLEDRALPSVTILATNNNGQGYKVLDFNQSTGFVPPDTSGAAGPNSYVETVNQAVAMYTPKATGHNEFYETLDQFFHAFGGLPKPDSTSELSDPIVAYDDNLPGLTASTGRFIIGDQDVDFNTHVSYFDFAVSKSPNPATLDNQDWNFYQINTTQAGFDADYPGNFGYNNDAFVFTLNMFSVAPGPDHVLVTSVNAADLVNGVSNASLRVFQNNLNDFAVRPTAMHDAAAGSPMWLVTEHGDGLSIDAIKMSNVLSTSATFTYTNLAVSPYQVTNPSLNPSGSVVTSHLDSRILSAAEANNTIVATHSVGVGTTQDVAQWYAINVSSGTPVLQQQGRVSAGNNTYLTYPGIDINPAGDIGMSYSQSGTDVSTDFMSMYVTGRTPSDPAGTMETPVLVPAGTGQADYADFTPTGRQGDLSAINVDPADGSFWAANEFANTEANANWGTAVANFSVGINLPPADVAVTASGPSSVLVGTNATYTITVTNNGPNPAQALVLKDTLPAGSNFVSMTQTSGTDPFTLTQSGGTATETATAAIAPNSSDTFTLVVAAPPSLPNGANFSDTATVSAANSDPNPSNNAATVTGSVVNNSPSADLSAAVTGPTTANEGDLVTYSLTVANAGPGGASGVVFTDTLPAGMTFSSATVSQGTFTVSGNVVTFNAGGVNGTANVGATVTAQAGEEGTGSDNLSVTSNNPDPNPNNNSASTTTQVNEPPINVSGAIRYKAIAVFNVVVATFTHGSGVEPPSAFSAVISWGDGTTSPGTITESGTTYQVRGTHQWPLYAYHTVSATVTEIGSLPNGPIEGGKAEDGHPGDDLVQFDPDHHHHHHHDGSSANVAVSGPTGSSQTSTISATALTLLASENKTAAQVVASGASLTGPDAATGAADHVFSSKTEDPGMFLVVRKHSLTWTDWIE